MLAFFVAKTLLNTVLSILRGTMMWRPMTTLLCPCMLPRTLHHIGVASL
jgi:hypothetical protein